jgi:sugar (pentulose or hexulose) kinase
MLEGTCFEAKRCMEAFVKGGFELKKVLCTGPTTRDGFFMQVLSNIIGMECIAVADENGSSLGAAYLAGLGISAWSLKDLPNMVMDGSKSYLPDKNAQEIYQSYYEKYIATSHHAKVCAKF